MIKAVATTLNTGWIYDAKEGWPQSHVQHYCVEDPAWQAIRKKMKGMTTVEKLATLKAWRDYNLASSNDPKLPDAERNWVLEERTQCQIDNYLGALRRGGILNEQNLIKRMR